MPFSLVDTDVPAIAGLDYWTMVSVLECLRLKQVSFMNTQKDQIHDPLLPHYQYCQFTL